MGTENTKENEKVMTVTGEAEMSETPVVAEGTDVSVEDAEVTKSTKKVHIMAGISFTLLKVHFTAGFEKDENGYQILLLPTNPTEKNGIKVKEMIADVNTLMGKSGAAIEGGENKMEEDITAAINGVNNPDAPKGQEKKEGFDPLELEVCLKQAFLYYKKVGDNKTFEYAFQLEINMKDMMPDIGLVTLDNVSIAVWSTERKKILESMSMFHIEDVLREYE